MSDLKTDLEWILSIHFSGNRMPHMSGDPRNRLSPGQRLRMDDVVQSIMEIVQQREQAARREGMEEAAQLVDCGCDIREAVLARLESQGEKRASYLCSHGDVCSALQAAVIRAAVKEAP